MPADHEPQRPAHPRSTYFTPRWFADLLSARLSLGDTFWAGLFGTALFFVPAGFILFFMASLLFDPTVLSLLSGLFLAIMALFHMALTTAVFRTARRAPQVGAWRWVGVLLALINAVILALTAIMMLGGPLPG